MKVPLLELKEQYRSLFFTNNKYAKQYYSHIKF